MIACQQRPIGEASVIEVESDRACRLPGNGIEPAVLLLWQSSTPACRTPTRPVSTGVVFAIYEFLENRVAS